MGGRGVSYGYNRILHSVRVPYIIFYSHLHYILFLFHFSTFILPSLIRDTICIANVLFKHCMLYYKLYYVAYLCSYPFLLVGLGLNPKPNEPKKKTFLITKHWSWCRKHTQMSPVILNKKFIRWVNSHTPIAYVDCPSRRDIQKFCVDLVRNYCPRIWKLYRSNSIGLEIEVIISVDGHSPISQIDLVRSHLQQHAHSHTQLAVSQSNILFST